MGEVIPVIMYDDRTGEIIQYGLQDTDVYTNNAWETFHAFVEEQMVAEQQDTHYIDISGTPTLTARPTLPDLVEGPTGTWTASNCPTGMQVEVWDTEINELLTTVTETSGSIEIVLADPGPYRLDSSIWPYLEKSIKVEVV